MAKSRAPCQILSLWTHDMGYWLTVAPAGLTVILIRGKRAHWIRRNCTILIIRFPIVFWQKGYISQNAVMEVTVCFHWMMRTYLSSHFHCKKREKYALPWYSSNASSLKWSWTILERNFMQLCRSGCSTKWRQLCDLMHEWALDMGNESLPIIQYTEFCNYRISH